MKFKYDLYVENDSIQVIFEERDHTDRSFSVHMLNGNINFFKRQIKIGNKKDSYIFALKAAIEYLENHPELLV